MPVSVHLIMWNERTREVVKQDIIANDLGEVYKFRDRVWPPSWGWREARISLDTLKP